MVLLQEGEHLLEICRLMNKGIRFDVNQYLRATLHRTITNAMLVYFFYALCYLLRREKKQNLKVLHQEKEYN